MEFLRTTEEILVFSAIALLITLWILHEIIKSAVYAAIIKSRYVSKPVLPNTLPIIKDELWSADQIELQRKYDKGEITLEEYIRDFNK